MNLKLLTYDQIEYFINKYSFELEENAIKCRFNYLQNKVRYLPFNGKTSIIYFPEKYRKGNEKLRWNYSILSDTKELYKLKEGKWNLILTQQLISKLILNKIDWTTLTNEKLDYEYEKIKAHYFIHKGGSI